jgi:acyl dehydratase
MSAGSRTIAAGMADESVIGKSFPPTVYAVGREKIREYAMAVGETNPLHHDVEFARKAGYADVVAPPMFAVVYSSAAIGLALFDPEIGIDFERLLHGGQEFRWGPLVVAGDDVTTSITLKEISRRAGMGFYVFESVSTNQRGETVCVGLWSNIVREPAA